LLPTALDVLDACRADKATVGVVPAPQDGEDDPWWVHMHGEGEGSPRVFGRLPFLEGMDGEVTAYTIGQVPLEASGDDFTWLVVETVEELSRSRVLAWTGKAGITARMRAMHSPKAFPASFYLLEAEGFVAADAEALRQMRAAAGKALGRLSHIGIIARPIPLDGA
jgi:hypothetical protein